jgi:YfiH family protein
MPFIHASGLRYYTFASFPDNGLVHGIFTRQGGVSPAPWASLNMGGGVGDDLKCVRENRRRAFAAVGRPFESNFDVWQVHSADVVVANAPRSPDQPYIKADAILTDNPGVTLLMRFGDCVPILLYDPRRKVVGMAHAGWLGTVRLTVKAAVEAMQAHYGCRPADIFAGIGPSIALHHYQVGREVVAQVKAAFGDNSSFLLHEQEGAVKFDLWGANRLVLETCGVKQIEVAGICTACHLEDWYSHRGENGKAGRFGALIGLTE